MRRRKIELARDYELNLSESIQLETTMLTDLSPFRSRYSNLEPTTSTTYFGTAGTGEIDLTSTTLGGLALWRSGYSFSSRKQTSTVTQTSSKTQQSVAKSTPEDVSGTPQPSDDIDGATTASVDDEPTSGTANQSPTAIDDSFSASEDSRNALASVLSNDRDADGDTLKVLTNEGTTSKGGIFEFVAGGGFVYTPPANFSGTDSFQYQISDGNGGTSTGTATIDVAGVADAPNLNLTSSVQFAQSADASNVSVPLDIRASLNDNDGSETLSVTISGLPQGATLSAGVKNADGSWTLSQGELVGVFLDLPPEAVQPFQLQIVATSQELSNGDIATANGVIQLSLAGSPTTGDDDGSSSGGGTSTGDTSDGGTSTGGSTGGDTSDGGGTSTGGGTSAGGSSGGSTYPGSINPAPTGGVPGQTYSGTFLQPTGANDIVGFRLENNTGSADGANYVSFGQVFVKGDVPAGGELVVDINGVSYPVQMDVKATHDDGSAKHAILTFQSPALSSGQQADAMLSLGTGASGSAITATDILNNGYNVTVDVNFANSGTVSVDVAQLLQTAVAQGNIETWMSGPNASEFTVSAPLNSHLNAEFHIRVFADGDVRTDVVISQQSTYTGGAQTYTYDVNIKDGGQSVYSSTGINHHPNSMWHTQVWDGNGAPAAFVAYDIAYMAASGALASYDTSLGIKTSLLTHGQNADFGPMGTGTIATYMPGTGGRDDIGILPQWTTNYLVTQDQAAYDIMMGNANAAGSIPWHYIDEATGEYVSIVDHPNLWMDSRQTGGTDALAQRYNSAGSGWTTDSSHNPDLSYVPYLLTGDQYHLDNLMAQSSYLMARVDPNQRATGANGSLFVDMAVYQQLRGSAWSIRTVSNAEFIAPDSHALSNELTTILGANLDFLHQKYLTDGFFNQYGAIEGFYEDYGFFGNNPPGVLSPWTQDFMASVLGLISGRGFTQATSLLGWSENFTSGRFINGDSGLDPTYGSSYRFHMIDPNTGNPSTTWAEVFTETQSGGNLHTGYPYSGDSYLAYSRAAVVETVNATGSIDAIEAFGFIVYNGDNNQAYDPSVTKSFYGTAQWLTMPKMSDGTYLSQAQVTVSNGNINGNSYNELIYGGVNADTIKGGGGIDWLFGNDGNDNIYGDAGNDILFGGRGNDFLYGGAGNDILRGGTGSDTFVFGAGGIGNDTIDDFDLVQDQLTIDSSYASSMAELAALASNVNGALVIDFGNGDTITLEGLSTGDLQSLGITFG